MGSVKATGHPLAGVSNRATGTLATAPDTGLLGCPVATGESSSAGAVSYTGPLARAFYSAERRHDNSAIAGRLGVYLAGLLVFVHFVTLTLRDKVRDGYRIPCGRRTVERAWSYWCALVRNLTGEQPQYLRVTEYQRRGVPHVHALTTNTAGCIGFEHDLTDALWDKYGRAQMLRYNPRIGAGRYLSKYLGKDSRVEIAASGRLYQYAAPRRTVCAGVTGAVQSTEERQEP